jgi:hypothetical protein
MTESQKSYRRAFLRGLAGFGGLFSAALRGRAESVIGPQDIAQRDHTALNIRTTAAVFENEQAPAVQANTGDEANPPGYIGCFTKGLRHDALTEVESSSSQSLLQAISSGKHSDFENIIGGSGMKLVDPRSAYAYALEGADSHRLACPPAPSFSSAQAAIEMVELHWQALARDVPFAEYAGSPIIQAACKGWSRSSGFQGARQNRPAIYHLRTRRAGLPGRAVYVAILVETNPGQLEISAATVSSAQPKLHFQNRIRSIQQTERRIEA